MALVLDTPQPAFLSNSIHEDMRNSVSYSKKRERNVSENFPIRVEAFQDHSIFSQSDVRKSTAWPTSRNGLSESLSFPSRIKRLQRYIEALVQIRSELDGFNNDVLKFTLDIISSFVISNDGELVVSKTSENEILLYTSENNSYKNILIDDDGDMQFMFIASNRNESFNEYFDKGNTTAFILASKL
jgi:hypothetical protein